jgi:hypothetical protein
VVTFLIDGVVKATLSSGLSPGVRVETGLESYAGGAAVEYLITGLKYQKNDGGFSNFAGQDAKVVTGAGMCGRWSGATAWDAGINVTC